jgi:transcriptional regulator
MYAPPHFAESDPQVLRDAVRSIRAGHLVTSGTDGMEASFVPLLISDDASVVTGHLARANPQWRRADATVEALVTWVGPDAYVSPGYYPSKAEHGKVVPTWNFIAVQARGRLTFHEDVEWTRAQVSALTRFHEEGRPAPWAVTDAPADYVDSMLRGVVGFEVRVTTIEGKWKLSQNRGGDDVAGVVAGLAAFGPGSPEAMVASAMVEVAARNP